MKKKHVHKLLASLLAATLLTTQMPIYTWAAEETAPSEVTTSLSEEESTTEEKNESIIEEENITVEENTTEEETASDDSSDPAGPTETEEPVQPIIPEEPASPLEITDKNHNETVFTVSMNKYKMPANGKQLTAAVWSDEKDQDDLKWYTMNPSGDRYTVDVDIQNHKTTGPYQVHIYLREADGKMVCLEKGTFSVTPVKAGELEIQTNEKDSSTAKMILHDVVCPSGVRAIEVPVWSKADQKDIYWYKAVKTSDNTWTADLKISNHPGAESGTFQVHVYGTNGIGARTFISKTTTRLEKAKPVVSAEATSTGLKLTLNNCSVAAPKDVRFAVWSEKNGQDDLKWYVLSGTTRTTTIPHPTEAGKFNIHCYVNNAGTLVFQNSTTYMVEMPTAGKVTATVSDAADGTFSLSISEITMPEQIKEITVPVWSAADQSDIYWYKAVKANDGTWKVDGSAANHKNHAGTYQAHVYVTALTGARNFACKTQFQVKTPETTVTAKYSADLRTLQMSASYIASSEEIREVRFAVWTEANNQDDLKWYTATLNKGIYSATAPMTNHPGTGPLHVHAYAVTRSGKMFFVKSTKLPLSYDLKAVIRTEEFSQERFTSDVFVDLSDYTMAIKKVEIATWSMADQSDIYWYQAEQAGGDSWHAAFTPLKHKGNAGTFKMHVYVTFANGTRVYAGSTNYTVSFENRHFIMENADGTVTAILYADPNLKSPSVAVWSIEGGQDDLKWYPLVWNGGCFTAVLSIRNHKHNGTYAAHFYGAGVFQGANTFTFPETIGSTESIYRGDHMGHSDVKFMNGKLLASQNQQLVLLNMNGTVFKRYPQINAFWLYGLDAENLIVYSNYANQLGILKLDANYNIQWNRTIAVMDHLTIDPAITKTTDGYMVTATEIVGNVNNPDPNLPNGQYTIRTWTSHDLVNWKKGENIITANQNLEDVDLYEKDGNLYLIYEQEIRDKGNSSIMAKVSTDQGKTWSQPIELLPADCDHEPAVFTSNGDRFILFYSADKANPGTSYMGAKAYYAVYDKNLNCISKDIEVKTGAKGGVLWYDVTWIDSTHYILYAENYFTTGTLVVEKAR